MQLAYIYGRVSTEEQSKYGYSIENQRIVCNSYANANGYKITAEYFDEGKTGRNTHRDEFQAMLKAVKDKPVEAIIIYKIDRLFRSLKDFSITIAEFKKQKVKLLSVSEGGEVGTGLLGKLMAAFAEHESEVIGMRTKDGMHQKFKEGYYPGCAPLGYINVTRDERKIIEPDPKTAPLIKEMFKLYATGQYSQLELCLMMHDKGLRGRKNNKMLTPQTLSGIFNNTLYYGWMKWGGLEGIGKHKPLINKDHFDQVQYALAKNNHFLIRKRKYFFLLRGFVYCPIHETRLTADYHGLRKSSKRTSICYYRCTHRGGCRSSYCETQKLERKIANLFKKYEFSDDFINLVKKYAKQHLKNGRNDLLSKKKALQNQKKGIEQKRNKLEDLLVDGAIDREVYKRQHTQAQEQLIIIERQLQELGSKHEVDFSVVEEVLAMTRNLHQSYLDAPDFLKRHYLRLFFERIYIKDKKVVKIIETPIFKALREEEKLLIRGLWGSVREFVRTFYYSVSNQRQFNFC